MRAKLEEINQQRVGLNADIDKLKDSLNKNNALIMDAGGEKFKKLKQSLDKFNRDVADHDKLITRNKTVIDQSDGVLKKIDLEIAK